MIDNHWEIFTSIKFINTSKKKKESGMNLPALNKAGFFSLLMP